MSIVGFFREGGTFMYFILAISVLSLAIIIERFYFIFVKYNINGTALMAEIKKVILANNIDRGIKLCNQDPDAALSKVIKAGLLKANRSEAEIQDAVDEATLEVVPKVEKRLHFLGMAAQLSTLLGLTGTVQGLIIAFKAVGMASAEMKQSLLASGISIAMYTTLFGLIVAVPTLLFYSILEDRKKKICDEIDQYGVTLVNLLRARKRSGLKEVTQEAGE